jgi:hypothetical protein
VQLEIGLLERDDAGIGLGDFLEFEDDIAVVGVGHRQPPMLIVTGTSCGNWPLAGSG